MRVLVVQTCTFCTMQTLGLTGCSVAEIDGLLIVRRDWFRDYATPPGRSDLRLIVHSYDVATKPSPAADYTICTIWGMTHPGDYCLLECRRVRLVFPDLLRLARELIRLFPPPHDLVEDERR